MKKQNKVKLNTNKRNIISEEGEDNVFRFVTTIACIIIILIAIYLIVGIFFTKEIDFSKKDDDKKSSENVTIDNKTITAGQIFDQKDDSYYVLIYDFDSKLTNLSTFVSVYSSKDGSIPIYKVDSGSKFNSNYISEKESNTNPTSYDDLKIKSPTLIKIENKNVTSYIEDESQIKSTLKGE